MKKPAAKKPVMVPFNGYATMPKSIRVGGYDYAVVVRPAELFEAKGLYGCVTHKALQIELADELNPHHLGNTLLHEVIHAIHFVYIRNSDPDEEETTNQTANGLHQVYRDTPGFASWLDQCFASVPA